MTVEQLEGVDGAREARGHVVVIDVLRAFSTAAYALASGAREIIVVGTPEEAFALREEDPARLLVGESGGRQIPGFDFGNSPHAMSRESLADRTIVLRSSSGTQGVVHASQADAVWLGSLVVARATTEALRAREAQHVTLVAMGSPYGPDGDEDVACSDYMAGLLRDAPVTAEAILRRVHDSDAGQQALDPAAPWITPEDLTCAEQIDCFDFAMEIAREGARLIARRSRSSSR